MISFLKKNFLVFVFFILIIELFKINNTLINDFYYPHIYKNVSNILFFLFGNIPFSVGDIIYIIIPLYIIIKLKNSYTRRRNFVFIIKTFATIYIFFQLNWGLNYHNNNVINKLYGIEKYDFNQLVKVTNLFVEKTNIIHNKLSKSDTIAADLNYNYELVFNESIKAVNNLDFDNKIYLPKQIKIKRSLFSTPLSYIGFSGYINPFTLEAQINNNVPELFMPVTTSHEISHLKGYAKENEANFIGILASVNSKNLFLSYSGNIQALRYLLVEVRKQDKKESQKIIQKINKGVLKNISNAEKKINKYSNPFEPYIKEIYGFYLKANNQKDGIKSYNQVVRLLVGYYSNQ
tara:strand:- start:8056 stop:9099 length:1044 start_codon:yes stop_codon:yes gene_type:complete